jgi:hypothetical protein
MRRSGKANSITVGTDTATIEGGGDLLARNRWQRKRQQLSSIMAGVAVSDSARGWLDTPNPFAN